MVDDFGQLGVIFYDLWFFMQVVDCVSFDVMGDFFIVGYVCVFLFVSFFFCIWIQILL